MRRGAPITRKACVVLTNRANYSSIKTAMQAIQAHPDLELQLVLGASTLLPRFGEARRFIEADGFVPNEVIYTVVEGENPITMAKTTGLGIIEISTAFQNLKPDVVLTVGDRYETMGTAVAASYMNIPLAQTMGGEVSGTIDESVRHAVTKLSNIHFPANEPARQRIIRMGEREDCVFNVGCPRVDMVLHTIRDRPPVGPELFTQHKGVGGTFDLDQPFLLVSQHPVTTEYTQARGQIEQTLEALRRLEVPTIMLWPNIDSGSDLIAKGIRAFRESHPEADRWLHLFTSLPPETYTLLMNQAACIVGNSSSAIREGASIGVPAVNVGSRQSGRDRGRNCIDVPNDADAIHAAVERQVAHGKYEPDHLYGDGGAGKRIADVLATVPLSVQKQITY